jgi:hypothetical protein
MLKNQHHAPLFTWGHSNLMHQGLSNYTQYQVCDKGDRGLGNITMTNKEK